jgi:pimeloyl-ACP methyl ester carboxylesterase
MRTEQFSFFSHGARLAGVLHTPDTGGGPWPVVMQGPGWLELACSAISEPYHAGFTAAGYAVVTLDYRGFGESEGPRGWLRPQDQIEDIHAAIAWTSSRAELDLDRLGLFAIGGTGGGNAIYVAAAEPRVKALCAMSVVADGPDWLHRMRREYEWVAFKRRVEENRRRVAAGGIDELVDPREDLMVATPERRATQVRASDDNRVGAGFRLSSAESLMRYRPIDVVDRISPGAVLLTAVVDDVVTPEDHAVALYEKAGVPKKLIRMSGVSHYDSYSKGMDRLLPAFLDWYGRHLVHGDMTTREQAGPER